MSIEAGTPPRFDQHGRTGSAAARPARSFGGDQGRPAQFRRRPGNGGLLGGRGGFLRPIQEGNSTADGTAPPGPAERQTAARPDARTAARPDALACPFTAEQVGQAPLRHLAEVAAGQPAPPRPTGTVEHLESANWFLNSSVTDGRTTSAVVPEQWRSWRTEDGASREVRRELSPIFRSEADLREWKRRGGQIDSSEKTRDYTAGEYYSHWQGPVPTDATALREWLTTGVPAHEAPVQYLESVTELAGVRLLTPAQRAAALRLFAELPGITVTGTVTDRAGRPGEAFSITSDFHGLPAQYTVIIDSGSGALLGYEEVLTETAGMLNGTIPAVITYRSYLVAEYAAMPR